MGNQSGHGANENHFYPLIGLGIALFIAWLCHRSPDVAIPIAELTGQALHRLGLFLVTVVVALFGLGGWRFRVVDELKADLRAFAIVAAAIILGAAIVLGGR